MKKIKLFTESLKLVWKSAPAWAAVNVTVSFARSFLPLVLLYLIKLLIDSLTEMTSAEPAISFNRILWLIIFVVAVFFLDEISNEFSVFIRKKQALKLESYMYSLLHMKAVRLDLIHFENPEYYDCLSRASKEAPWRPNSILNNLVSVLRGFISLLLMTWVLITLHWWLAILLVAVNIPAVWLRLHYADLLYNFQKEHTPDARKTAYFNWLLTGDRPARELRLFGLGNYFMSLFRESFRKHKEEEISILKKRTLIETISNIFKAAAFFAALFFVARNTAEGKISLGGMAMLILAFRQGMLYLKEIFGSLAGLYEDSLFISDVFEFLNLKENIIAPVPAEVCGPLDKNISAIGITFSYPGSTRPVLNNVSFEIGKGEIVAFVGPNGAGKSTLVRLLCRLYDTTGGDIRYDGKNIRNIDPAEYRQQFSVVFQDFMLYNLTAGENIRLGNVENPAVSTKIEGSARQAGLHELIGSLPEGYDTVIGNLFRNSRELSWGEWQKIAIARSLYREASVLILDEPSSALDADTEYEIFNRFRSILKGRTAVLISHRFTNVRLADRIFVLNKGIIEESGSHDELMKRKGTYYNMYTRQTGRYDDEK